MVNDLILFKMKQQPPRQPLAERENLVASSILGANSESVGQPAGECTTPSKNRPVIQIGSVVARNAQTVISALGQEVCILICDIH